MPTPVVPAKCAAYNFTDVLPAIERIIAALGGPHRFIRPGQTVLLKPNLPAAHNYLPVWRGPGARHNAV